MDRTPGSGSPPGCRSRCPEPPAARTRPGSSSSGKREARVSAREIRAVRRRSRSPRSPRCSSASTAFIVRFSSTCCTSELPASISGSDGSAVARTSIPGGTISRRRGISRAISSASASGVVSRQKRPVYASSFATSSAARLAAVSTSASARARPALRREPPAPHCWRSP